MMDLFGDPNVWLPFTFAALMGVSILIYVVLDGFDLGVGLLMPLSTDEEKDRLVASIGPFWDANERDSYRESDRRLRLLSSQEPGGKSGATWRRADYSS